MANKERLNKITQISNNEEAAVALFNENVDKVNRAIEDSLSRTNALPNNMKANLDMGDNAIINLKMRPVEKRDDGDVVVWGEIKDFTGASKRAEDAAVTAEGWSNEAKDAANLASARASDSEDSADLSKAWATADDFDDRLEGESSSKAYSNLAMAIANTPEDVPVNMSELQSTVILKGDSATVKIANVSTLPPGQEAYVRNIGNERDAVFEIGLPRAEQDVYAQGNLGDIRSTTAWTLPKGCAWCDGSWKTQAEYPDMYEAVRTRQVAVQTASWYETHLSNYGCCAYFVLDEANKRFRIPALKGNIMFGVASGVSPFEYGRYQPAGLPNIAGHFYGGLSNYTYYGDGAFYRDSSVKGNTDPYGDGGNRDVDSFGFSASRSNPIYGRSSTVQPEALLLNYYVVLSESRKSIYCPKPSVATFADLPMSGNILGDTRVALDTSIMYVWSQTAKGSYAWTSVGSSVPTGGVTLAEWGSVGGDITAQEDLQVALSKKLENLSTEGSSLALGRGSSATIVNSLALGSDSQAQGQWSAAIGSSANATAWRSLAIGGNARAIAANAIQIGAGENNTPRSLQVSFKDMWSEEQGGLHNDYILLTGDGKIPVERLPDDIGGTTALEDIATAGEGITFTRPVIANHIASADINGSPTISAEGILSDLSSSKYLKIDGDSISGYSGSLFTNNTYNWAWTVKFKTPTSFTSPHRIFTLGSSASNFNIWASISEGANPTGSLALGVHNSDDWHNLYDGNIPYIFETDTWYWLRVSRDVSTNTYKAEVSTDGMSWSTAYSFVSSSSLYDTNSTMFISQVSSSYVALEYDLTGVSFTSNYGSGINWTAYEYSNDKTLVSSNALLNAATGSFADKQILIKSSNGDTKLFVDYDGVFGIGSSSILMGSENVSGSFYNVIGYQAQAASHCVVFGYKAKATDSYATAIGDEASAKSSGVAVGSSSGTESYGTAIGKSSQAGYYGVGVGGSAISSANYAIQIGRGTNSTANTMNVGLSNTLNVQLLDADGKIPMERLPENAFFAPATNTWTALSLGASNTEYTAPANGYFVLYAQQQDGNEKFISMRNKSVYGEVLGADHYWNTTFGAARLFVPAKKGHKIIVEYNCALRSLWFGFIPADGTV